MTGYDAATLTACAKAADNPNPVRPDDEWWDGYDSGRSDAAEAIRALPIAPPAPAVDDTELDRLREALTQGAETKATDVERVAAPAKRVTVEMVIDALKETTRLLDKIRPRNGYDLAFQCSRAVEQARAALNREGIAG